MRVLHLLAEDPVIFHLFALELKAVYDRLEAEPDEHWAALIPAAFAGSWRHRALEGLLPVFTDPAALPADHQLLPFGPAQLDAGREESWLVAPHRFRHYDPCPRARGLVARIQRHHGVHAEAPSECVLIQRRGSRVLHAAETAEPLEHWLAPRLAAAGIPFRLVVLEELEPLEQWRAMARARLLIGVHGSGLTNLVFTPQACRVLEIDFRRYWHCDPLCEGHRSGALPYTQPCGAPRRHRPEYHKADYHNLCGLLGRAYEALSLVEARGFRSHNPIEVDLALVQGEALLEQIQRCFGGGSRSVAIAPSVATTAPRIAVLSSFYGRPPWSKSSLANHLAYCLRHGYDYLPALHRQCPERHHSWERVQRAAQLLSGDRYDAVFWMDGDSWFLDASWPLQRFLADSSAPIQFTGDQSDVINTGHLLLRRHHEAVAFLEAWWQIHRAPGVQLPTSHLEEGALMDGPAAIALLGGAEPGDPSTWLAAFNRINGCPGNPARHLRSFQSTHHPLDNTRARRAHAAIADRWRPFCHVWPQGRLNAYPWSVQPGDFILHFVGDSKHLCMHDALGAVERYPAGCSVRTV